MWFGISFCSVLKGKSFFSAPSSPLTYFQPTQVGISTNLAGPTLCFHGEGRPMWFWAKCGDLWIFTELTIYWFINETILNYEDVRKKSYANTVAVWKASLQNVKQRSTHWFQLFVLHQDGTFQPGLPDGQRQPPQPWWLIRRQWELQFNHEWPSERTWLATSLPFCSYPGR